MRARSERERVMRTPSMMRIGATPRDGVGTGDGDLGGGIRSASDAVAAVDADAAAAPAELLPTATTARRVGLLRAGDLLLGLLIADRGGGCARASLLRPPFRPPPRAAGFPRTVVHPSLSPSPSSASGDPGFSACHADGADVPELLLLPGASARPPRGGGPRRAADGADASARRGRVGRSSAARFSKSSSPIARLHAPLRKSLSGTRVSARRERT